MKTAKRILDTIESAHLSKALWEALRLSRHHNSPAFEKWCRLELVGYYSSNPAMDENVVVPEYRTVVGQHSDYFGRPLILEHDLAFFNDTRLRNGVPELESLAKSQDMVAMQDTNMCRLIKHHLDVEVHVFRFSCSELAGLISAIQMRLSDWLQKIPEPSKEPLGVDREDLFELKPNFHGIGVDLKALWRKCTGTSKS